MSGKLILHLAVLGKEGVKFQTEATKTGRLNMTLLREIQTGATNSSIDISTLLRKAKILAARLQNPEFENWVDRELNGYDNKEGLPPYRVVPIVAKGTLSDGFRIWNDFNILTSFLPDKFKAWGEECYLAQPIAMIASLATKKAITIPWPQELAVKYGAKGTNACECLRAWQEINPVVLVGIVDTVRNRLLDFVLKIERENPEAGEVGPNIVPVPMEKLQPLVHNIFYGPVGNIAQSSKNFRQVANMGISPEDLSRLVTELTAHLGDLNLSERQIQRAQLQLQAIQTELEGETDSTLVIQAGRTLRNITEGAISSLIATGSQPAIWHWIHQTLAAFGVS